MADSTNRPLDWGDTIEHDGEAFVLLPAGVYPFRVAKFERGWHDGSSKIPACNKANLTLEVDGGDLGTATIQTSLLLHSKLEWKLCEFFISIGARKSGEALTMRWDTVPGARGLCRVSVHKWKGDDGRERESNRIEGFVAPQGAAAAPAFTPGKF